MSDLISRKEIIDRLERVIQNGVPSEDGMHPISAETVLEVVKSQLSTNLAEVGTDCISRQAAIDALRYAQHRFTVADEAGGMGTVKWSEYVIYFAAAERVLSDLPSAQPEIIRCKDCKYAEYIDDVKTLWCTECGQGRTVAPNDFAVMRRGDRMNIEQEKMIVEALSSLYPLKDYEEDAINTVLEALPHWIPVTERLPEEEDSIFARYYGTDRWSKSMFRKKSRDVIVTSVFEDGELHTEVAHTTDGEWHVGVNFVPRTVIAWMPLPEPYKGVTIPPECEGDCGWCKPSVIEKCKGVTDGRD